MYLNQEDFKIGSDASDIHLPKNGLMSLIEVTPDFLIPSWHGEV